MRKLTTLLLLCGFVMSAFSQSAPTDLVFTIQAQVFNSGTLLTWNQLSNVSSYNVLRKHRSDKNFTVIASNLPVNQNSFLDATTSTGEAYEYCVQSSTNNSYSGYIYAGKELAAVHQQGEVLLLIDNTYKEVAQTEITQYKLDLVKEGWKVKTAYVNRTQSVNSVKALIQNAYTNNPTGFKGSILLGHIPVPYSGNIAPDAHPDHKGAWPSDMYYADVTTTTGSWNDVTVQTITASDIRNHNIIGDGKYDISVTGISNQIKLFVGRIDVYNMPAINADDALLFKQYLKKNHSYRSVQKTFQNRAMVQDNFGYFAGEAFAQNGWRNFGNIFGSSEVHTGDYFTTMNNNSYVWSYACGGGTYTTAQGIGTTSSFKTDKVESVFTMLFGSYFGDWDNQNNFLRGPIASPSSTLVSIWGGRPNWFMHNMVLGEPVGYSYISSVNNSDTYFPRGYYSGQVHQNMQGDPTLKMYMFKAPTNLTAIAGMNELSTQLQWSASLEPGVIGYYVYKAFDANSDFELLNSNYITNNSFEDLSAYNPQAVYMVRAVRLEETISGSFYNLSPGVLSNELKLNITLPVNLISFDGVQNSNRSNTLTWKVSNEAHLAFYELQRSADGIHFEDLAQVTTKGSQTTEVIYHHIDAAPLEVNYYRLQLVDENQTATYSNVVKLSNPFQQTTEVLVYPSPFNSQLNVQFYTEDVGTIHLALQDMYGRIIHRESIQTNVGNQVYTLPNLDHLAKGFYLLRYQDPASGLERVTRVVKD